MEITEMPADYEARMTAWLDWIDAKEGANEAFRDDDADAYKRRKEMAL